MVFFVKGHTVKIRGTNSRMAFSVLANFRSELFPVQRIAHAGLPADICFAYDQISQLFIRYLLQNQTFSSFFINIFCPNRNLSVLKFPK